MLICSTLFLCGCFGKTETSVPIVLPPFLNGDSGKPVYVEADTRGEIVKWVALDNGLEFVDQDKLKNTKMAVVFGPMGSYRLLAYTSDVLGPSDPAICVIKIGNSPTPPDPPVPVPDALKDAVVAAFNNESAFDKADKVHKLAAVYGLAVTDLVNKPEIVTAGNLLTVLKNTADSMVGSGALPAVRRALADHLNKVMPLAPNAVLDPATKEKCKAEFLKISTILEGLK